MEKLSVTYLELASPDAAEPLHRGELDRRQHVFDLIREEVIGVLLGANDNLDLLPGEARRQSEAERRWLCCLVLPLGHRLVDKL